MPNSQNTYVSLTHKSKIKYKNHLIPIAVHTTYHHGVQNTAFAQYYPLLFFTVIGTMLHSGAILFMSFACFELYYSCALLVLISGLRNRF